MNLLKCLLRIACFLPLFKLPATFDLNSMKSDCIIETKQIIIPEYPTAFNPSITRWNGKLLLIYRIREPNEKVIDKFGLSWLDENFDPVGSPYILERRNQNLEGTSWAQDPRLVVIHNKLFIIYNNTLRIDGVDTRRMIVAELHYDGKNFFTDTYARVLNFEGNTAKLLQKNWSPFEYNNRLFLSYSVDPHRVEVPIDNCEASQTVSKCEMKINYSWGEIRGGTPALFDGDRYLAFFHSSKDISTVQSGGKKILHYFMGAYTFSDNPPFKVLTVSPEPIVHPSFYDGPMHKTWKPLRCVFPCGILIDGAYVWVTYGKQDHESWVVKFDKQKLLESLVETEDPWIYTVE